MINDLIFIFKTIRNSRLERHQTELRHCCSQKKMPNYSDCKITQRANQNSDLQLDEDKHNKKLR